ncbi:MAG: hypothetical protein KBG20_11995 [Caldilineaceae bacterium]|nr:hypothetical protein [Caldilineaceae bacterium]MBP8107947.1 hypothetical protein [Caldilineaceae bacterium]MBP8122985.1 hypothetical protein [Caldilineaceae bacterium]MBP9073020.1 hypothetical protein [Caldilineaceae bacterium]
MSSNSTSIGRFAGLDLSITPGFWIGCALLTGLIGLGLALFAAMSPLAALGGGLLGTLLYWFSEILHNLGHALAAKRTGYPMTGIRLGFLFILGRSLYPADEGELPAAVHMRRAAGGPILSATFGLVAIAVGVLMGNIPGAWVTGFGLLNVFLFGLGALVPIGFTDGSTLLYWRNRP